MKKLLTVRKAKWVAQRKPDVIRGNPLNPNAAVTARYYDELKWLVDLMTANVEKKLVKFFETGHVEEFFAADASTASQARIITNALAQKFNALFGANAKPMAESMVKQSAKASSTALHSSLQQLGGGLSLPTSAIKGPLTDIINATVTENVGLIKSISAEYLQGVQGAVMRSITTGSGMQDLVPYLERHKGITLRRARMIATDQTRKAFNNISKSRMENLGVTEYEWIHTGGSNEPREYHAKVLNGKIFKLSEPPVIDPKTGERGIPGQLINCRCRMRPVINLNKTEE